MEGETSRNTPEEVESPHAIDPMSDLGAPVISYDLGPESGGSVHQQSMEEIINLRVMKTQTRHDGAFNSLMEE